MIGGMSAVVVFMLDFHQIATIPWFDEGDQGQPGGSRGRGSDNDRGPGPVCADGQAFLV
jgi:hypothetical protein